MSVTLLGQPIIIVNSQKIARDMLDKKATIYSDRPYLEMCSNLGQFGNLLYLMIVQNIWTDHFSWI